MSQSLVRAIKLLDCFDEKAEMSLPELVEKSGMPKTTVFRLVNSLEQAGLLVKIKYSSHDVKYRMGLKLLQLGKKVSSQLEYREIALPYMRELNEKLNESVHLMVIEGDEAVYIDKLDSRKPIRVVIEVGNRIPLYAGSGSKALLAHMNEDKREDYIERIELKPITENTITDKEKLREEIEMIRERGYAVSREELYSNTIGFSYPIFDSSGEGIASLGISISITEYSKEKEEVIVRELQEKVRAISEQLGYQYQYQ